jgi:hypothetical protein
MEKADDGTDSTTNSENIYHHPFSRVWKRVDDGTGSTKTAENIYHRPYSGIWSGVTCNGTSSNSIRAENTDCKLSKTLPVMLFSFA